MLFTVSLVAVLLSGLGFLLHVHRAQRRLLAQSWDSILAQVQAVDLIGLREIADCYLQPGKDQLRIEPEDMWHTVGGLNGIRRLQRNADAMLQLAVYAERWNTQNGYVVAEMIRRDAIRLRKAIAAVKMAAFLSIRPARAPFALQEAISSYCLMRGRLLGLYQVAHIGLLPQLEAAL